MPIRPPALANLLLRLTHSEEDAEVISGDLEEIIGRAALIAGTGIGAGLIAAIPSMQVLSALLYEVPPGDPVVFGSLALLVLAVTLLAGYIPARRATRVDPMVTLGAE